MTLRFELEGLGRWIWNCLHDAEASGLRQHETTLTQRGLARLWSCDRIEVWSLTSRAEGVIGWDYELLIRFGPLKWYHYAVQAKRLYGPGTGSRYDHYKQEQLEKVCSSGKRQGIYPLYGFYNYVDSPSEAVHWHCEQPYDMELLGFTVAPVWHVSEAGGIPNFDFIHRPTLQGVAVPVRCLLHPHKSRAHGFLPLHRGAGNLGVVSQDGADELEHWWKRDQRPEPDHSELTPRRLRPDRVHGRGLIVLDESVGIEGDFSEVPARSS